MSARDISKSLRRACKPYYPAIQDFGLLIIAFLSCYALAPLLRIGYRNPHNISNPLNGAGFNPDNNFYGILFVIVGTLVGFYILRRLYRSKYSWVIKLTAASMLLFNFFIVNCLTSPGYATGLNGMDNFHAGEQLAPSSAFMSGSGLYNDIFYLRGAGVDAVLPTLGFQVFGKSIGSFLLMSDLFMLAAIASFFILIAFLVRRPFAYIATILLFYVSDAVSILHVRDIPVWIALGLLLLSFKRGLSGRARIATWIGFGFVSSLSLYISIDRGVTLAILAAGLIATLCIVSADAENRYAFAPKAWRHNIRNALWPAVGMLAGIAIPALLLGWSAFIEFIKMTFLEIPNYGGLLVSQPYPGMFGGTYLFWAPVFLAIAVSLLLLRLFKYEKPDYNKLIPYAMIFIFGIICLKIGANRIALSKMASATAPLYLAAFLILVYAAVIIWQQRRSRVLLLPPAILSIAVIVACAQLNWAKLQQPDYTRPQLAAYRVLPHTPDDMWLTPQTSQVRDYILQNTKNNEPIFAFTSNPVYYYLTGRPNPSRFYVSWFADPQPYTNELLGDLRKTPPKLVIYQEGSWMDTPDTVPMQARIPEVDKWLTDNYPNKVMVGGTTILTK